MSGEDNKAVFRRAIDEGYNKGNLAAIDELFSPNFTDHQDAIWPRTTEGVKDFIKYVRAAFPDLKLTIEEIIAVGDKTWARTTAHGTHKGIFMDSHQPAKNSRLTGSTFAVLMAGKLLSIGE